MYFPVWLTFAHLGLVLESSERTNVGKFVAHHLKNHNEPRPIVQCKLQTCRFAFRVWVFREHFDVQVSTAISNNQPNMASPHLLQWWLYKWLRPDNKCQVMPVKNTASCCLHILSPSVDGWKVARLHLDFPILAADASQEFSHQQ